MKFHFKGKKVAKNLVSVASCGAMMLAFAPTAAFADNISDVVSGDAAMSADGYVTCAAARAAMPAPEILGLSGIEDNGESFSNVSEWSSPKYFLMGSDYNSSPNPYMYNNMLVATNKVPTASPTVIINKSRSGAQGPMSGLGVYGTTTNEDAILAAKPDVILGTLMKDGTNANYDTAEYAGAVDPSWHPKSVAYGMATLNDMVEMMYRLADAGDKVVAESNGAKKLRYGTAETIAQNYEKYIRGTRGYILKRLKDEGKAAKTIAVVSSVTDGVATLTASGKAEGTSSKNRYIEATESVAANYGDLHETATLDELKKNVDLVLIGGQSGGAGEGLVDTESISNALGADLLKKTYYVTGSSTAGSMYGVTVNSPENAQNIGRILGCLYPEYVDQDDWVSYYYDNFYHIKSDKLANAIDNAMDGVVNWDATGSDRTQWTTADASTYKKSIVQKKIDTGIEYLQSNTSSRQDRLDNPLSEHIKTTSVSKIKQTLTVKPTKRTVSSKKASTVAIKATAQGKLTYKVTKKASKKVTVSKTGKVTVKKGTTKGKYVVTVTAGATGEYKSASKTVTITVK